MGEWTIGVIGGSGLYAFEALEEAEWRTVETPWGVPSDAILFGRIGEVALASCRGTGAGIASRRAR